jgi:hypothetical protein
LRYLAFQSTRPRTPALCGGEMADVVVIDVVAFNVDDVLFDSFELNVVRVDVGCCKAE